MGDREALLAPAIASAASRVVCENEESGNGAFIRMDETGEDIAVLQRVRRGTAGSGDRTVVEVVDVDGEHPSQMPLVHDQQVIQALLPD